MRFCSVDGCVGKHHAKGLCKKHYVLKQYWWGRSFINRASWRGECAGCGVKIGKASKGGKASYCHVCYLKFRSERVEGIEKNKFRATIKATNRFKERVIDLLPTASKSVKEALVLDGEVLDRELKKRGVVE